MATEEGGSKDNGLGESQHELQQAHRAKFWSLDACSGTLEWCHFCIEVRLSELVSYYRI